MKLTQNQQWMIGGGVLLAVLYVASKGVRGVAADVGQAAVDVVAGALSGAYEALPQQVKPTSDQNVVYQAAGAVVRRLPGADDSDTLGTWLYNITHPNENF